MAPPLRSRPLRKDTFATAFKPLKAQLYTESTAPPRANSSYQPPPPNIRCLSWSPTGSQIATCVHANIRIWSPDRPLVKHSTEIRNGHPRTSGGTAGDVVEKIAFCPTMEGMLASTGHDGSVRLWDVRVQGGAAGGGKGVPLGDCQIGDQGHFLTWHPNGREILVGRKDDIVHTVDVRRVVVPETGAKAYDLQATERTPADKRIFNVMAFSNSGREVFATTQEGPVRILDYPSMTLLHTLSGHTASTYTVQQSPTGSSVAVGSGDSLVSLWDSHSWLCTNTLTSHTSSVRDLSFSFDGAYVVVGSGTDAKDGSAGLEVFHTDAGEVVHTIETKNAVTLAQWHPSRYWVAYAGEPGGLHILGANSVV